MDAVQFSPKACYISSQSPYKVFPLGCELRNTLTFKVHSSYFSFTLQGCRGALQNRHKNQIIFMLEVVRDKCLHKGERSSRALRHVLSRPSCPPLISTAWICKPVCSLRAQVSPVCPQISFVIRRTPCSSSAAPFNGTVVFMFVKLFTGTALNHVVSSNVGAWPLISPVTSSFQCNSIHSPV